ncbi:MAG: Brp/Blh family beta-carotene 15,15'-dioxygenase [Rubrivivax sp.]|nr:Brp/Blh family beta-carotene 15,15'-dioxygenase [Rubrivivax sp.]
MSPGLRLQGGVFSVLALACALAFVLAWVTVGLDGSSLAPMDELWLAAALIAVLGMPHGALDAVFARKLLGVKGLLGWAAFSLAYVGLAALVVALWALEPTLFLCGFLLVSALHFGGDLPARTVWVTRALYGGVIIVLPALMHAHELQRLLGMVAGPASAAVVTPVLAQMALPWLGATVVAGVLLALTSRLAALELTALAAVAVSAPPLLSFTVYFCAMHSPRHILRTLGSFPASELRQTLAMALWPTLAVFVVLTALVATAALGWQSIGTSAQTWVMQVVFVGLAALTLPHVVLLERARRAGLPLP